MKWSSLQKRDSKFKPKSFMRSTPCRRFTLDLLANIILGWLDSSLFDPKKKSFILLVPGAEASFHPGLIVVKLFTAVIYTYNLQAFDIGRPSLMFLGMRCFPRVVSCFSRKH
jgi:hypothetical protein